MGELCTAYGFVDIRSQLRTGTVYPARDAQCNSSWSWPTQITRSRVTHSRGPPLPHTALAPCCELQFNL